MAPIGGEFWTSARGVQWQRLALSPRAIKPPKLGRSPALIHQRPARRERKPDQGSFALFGAASLGFVLCTSCLGLLVSLLAKSQQAALMIIWQKAFALCHSLSHASSPLVPNTLKRIETASAVLSPKDLEQWLVHAYDIFDKGGIGLFLDFIVHIDEEALQKFKTPRGLHLQEVLPLLETFLRGISGSELKILAGKEAFTDTSTVYLPYVLDRYDDRGGNFLLYKIMVSHAWAQIAGGSLNPDAQVLRSFLGDRDIEHPDIGHIFSLLPEEENPATT